MKKLLFLSLLFVACSSETTSVEEVYDNIFITTFGQPAKDQDWGFQTEVTRSTIKEQHEWKSRNLVIPTKLTPDEINDVTDYFSLNRFSNYGEEFNFSNYWVEFVSKRDTTTLLKDGKFFRSNEHFTLDQFTVGTEQVNDWNANVHPLYFLENVGNTYKIWLSYTSQWVTDYTIQYYNGNYYLGFDLYGNKWDNGNLTLGETSRGFYNDYIVRLIPPTYTTDVRIIAEDLSVNESTDFDFNDVVFDVHYTSNSTAIITLQAAGGTIPLKVAGHEVHEEFGVPTTTMVNTGIGQQLNPVSFSINNVDISLKGKDIDIYVFKLGEWHALTANQGKPAAKIAVSTDFKYCSERQDILSKYPKFKDWVQNKQVIWY